jgi:hypothetical protein
MSLKVFNDWLLGTRRELLSYNIGLFNAATNGGLILRAAHNVGDFKDESYWTRISGLVRRRDSYGTGDVTAIDIDQLLASSVRVAAGTPPVNLPTSFLAWIGRDPKEAGVVMGKQLAEDSMADMVDTAIAALAAGIGTQASLIHDGTAAVMGLTGLNTGASKLGDRAGDLVCWLAHSKVLFDLYGAALANATGLFAFGNVKVTQDGFGRAFVISDSPSLSYVSSGTKYHTLGLVSGAAVVEQNDDYQDALVDVIGKENLSKQFQAEWSYQLALRGFTWDKTNGGASPTTAALATGTNWDKVSTSIKDLPGVMVNTL